MHFNLRLELVRQTIVSTRRLLPIVAAMPNSWASQKMMVWD